MRKILVTLTLMFMQPALALADPVAGPDAAKVLAAAVVCSGEPALAVERLVVAGGTYTGDYAATGFGDGTSYKVAVVMKEPVLVGKARARTFVSETEPSNSDFAAFTYGQFEGDHAEVVSKLGLKPMSGEDKQSGHFQRKVEDGTACPRTIMLTPLDGGRFLLGCGWCNGG